MQEALKDKKFIKRFWSKVDKTKYCWEWKGDKQTQGYGGLKWKKKGSYLPLRYNS